MPMSSHPTVPAVEPRAAYLGDGAQTVFPFPFPVLKAGDLRVFLDNALQAGGYSLSGLGASTGGVVTFAQPPVVGARITLYRAVSIERLSDFQEGGAFRAKVVNDEFDAQTMALQDLDSAVRRAARKSPAAPDGIDVTLPEVAPGQAIGWSDDGMRLVNDPSGLGAAVKTVERWAADVNGSLSQALDAAAAASASAGTAVAAGQDASASAQAALGDRQAGEAAAVAAWGHAQAGRADRQATEAFAASAAFDAFALLGDRMAARAAVEAARAAAERAADRAGRALARLEDVDLSLWRAVRAACRAEDAARRVAGVSAASRVGIGPDDVLPNWARLGKE